MKVFFMCVSAGIFCAAATAAGIPSALHGRPGSYMVRTKSNIALFRNYDLKTLSAAEQQKISKHWLHISAKHFTYCVSDRAGSGFAILAGLGKDCKFSNEKTVNGVFSADAVCHGSIDVHVSLRQDNKDNSDLLVAFTNMAGTKLPMEIRYHLHYMEDGCLERLGPDTMHNLNTGQIATLKK